jgi:diguanylate cyclase (GGDEF)-like protein
MEKRSLTLTTRFALVVIALVPSLAAVAAVGIHGLESGRDAVNSLYANNLVTVRDASDLDFALDDAFQDSLQLVTSTGATDRQHLANDLFQRVSPLVESDISVLSAESNVAERRQLARISAGWTRFQQLLASGSITGTSPTSRDAVVNELAAIFAPDVASAHAIIAVELAQGGSAHSDALAIYESSIRWMLLALVLALLAAASVVGWLIRSVLPRTLEYSAFAADVARGDYSKRLVPEGTDEIAELGRTLDDLAQRRRAEVIYGRHHAELVDLLQVAETEQEAHELVKRHLERSVRESDVTVLSRNNSDDRLEAVTEVRPGSPLEQGLDLAKPGSCLAVRMARSHSGSHGDEYLRACPVCSKCPDRTTCTPLLVRGEVIGSVLANHAHLLDEHEQRSIREAVTQAAPVLGNLRNLAIAELRAATDSLTGLPNKRALQDTLKRMVAQSSRSVSPLAALMCDLDHFKSINDRFGHGRGDEVLAAVGAVFADTLRASDFVGRYGGEEFLVLLPGSDTPCAVVVAEKIRSAVERIQIPTITETISISIGVAVMPDNAVDAETLSQAADRALYAAKKAGRNRVEVAATPRGDDLDSAPTLLDASP